jgi:uncharacterized FlaG/YvyC family protein
MDIKLVSQLSPAATVADAARAPVAAKHPQSEPRTQIDGDGKRIAERAAEIAARERAEAIKALQGPEVPRLVAVRAELNVDEASRRIFARIFDRETGEFVRQIPAEEKLRLLGITREQFSRIFKTDV